RPGRSPGTARRASRASPAPAARPAAAPSAAGAGGVADGNGAGIPWLNLPSAGSLELRQLVTREAQGAPVVVDAQRIADGVGLAVHEVTGRAGDEAVDRKREGVRHGRLRLDAGVMGRPLVVTGEAARLEVRGELRARLDVLGLERRSIDG